MYPDFSNRSMQAAVIAQIFTRHAVIDELVVGEETVKTHVGNILAKLQMAHRTGAVIRALKQGLLSLDDIDV